MKRTILLFTLVFLYLGQNSNTQAALITGESEWGVALLAGQSINSVASYIPDLPGLEDVIFTAIEFTNTYPGDHSLWLTELEAGGKAAYLYGPTTTNTGVSADWFSYKLYYQWDDAAVGYDPDFPIYQNTALYNGIAGSAPIDGWGWRGDPMDNESWDHQETLYEGQGGNNYTCPYDPLPIPEPITICVLALGAIVFAGRRRNN